MNLGSITREALGYGSENDCSTESSLKSLKGKELSADTCGRKRERTSSTTSLNDYLRAYKRRRVHADPLKVSPKIVEAITIDYVTFYGDQNQNNCSTSQDTTATTREKPLKLRHTRRCSVTKFSLEKAAKMAVSQLAEESFENLSSNSKISGNYATKNYKNITPVLTQALKEVFRP